MSSRRVNFPLNNAIALSDILRTAAIIEGILEELALTSSLCATWLAPN